MHRRTQQKAEGLLDFAIRFTLNFLETKEYSCHHLFLSQKAA